MTTSHAASRQHSGRRSGSTTSDTSRGGLTRRAHHTGDVEQPDPDDWENYSASHVLTVMPLYVRQRIREATMQMHSIIIERLRFAKRPQDAASEAGMAAELRSLVDARKTGTRNDVRCARLSLAASLVLLAEMDDRPPAPPSNRGQRRGKTKRWEPLDFSIPAT